MLHFIQETLVSGKASVVTDPFVRFKVSKPFHLNCEIKGVFPPIPPDHGLFDPSHLTGESIWNSEPDVL